MSFFLYKSGNEAEKKFKFFFHKMVGFYELKIFFDFIQKKSLSDFPPIKSILDFTKKKWETGSFPLFFR